MNVYDWLLALAALLLGLALSTVVPMREEADPEPEWRVPA